MKRPKERARRHGRPLQREAKACLEEAAHATAMDGARAAAERVRQRFAGRVFSDSAELIREGRER